MGSSALEAIEREVVDCTQCPRLVDWRERAAREAPCAPPGNKPLPQERDTCAPYLVRELAALESLRVVIALGAFAWDAALTTLTALGAAVPTPKPRFSHGAEVQVGARMLLGSYHVSQQNTYTGRLTRPMLDAVIRRATELAAR